MAMGRVEDLLAHVKNDQSGEVIIPHRLTDHLQKTAELFFIIKSNIINPDSLPFKVHWNK